MDQAIAHGEGRIEVAEVRQMLGLADRARVIDLFEHVMKGDAAAALAEIRGQYDVGADPVVIVADLAEFVHFVTRAKLVPAAGEDAAATEDERTRGRAFAETLSLRVLSRAWQMLLKGYDEVKAAPKALPAAEMLLVRLAYAADLPTPDEALKLLRDGAAAAPAGAPSAPRGPSGGAQASLGGGAHAVASAPMGRPASDPVASASAMPGPRLVASSEPAAMKATAQPQPQPSVHLASLHDVAALASEKRDIRLKLAIEKQLRPVRFETGRIEVVPTKDAAFDLPQELARKLGEWTGSRWVVAIGRDEGGATIAEEREAARDRLVTDARADPLVAAVLKRFPGAQIVDVRVNAAEGEETAAGTGEDGLPASDGEDPGWNPED